jgi:hypothetical protein
MAVDAEAVARTPDAAPIGVVAIASPWSADSFDKKLKRFVDRVLRKGTFTVVALAECGGDANAACVAAPKQEDRHTAALARPSFQAGEVLAMQRLGFLDGRTTPSTAAKEAYDSIFGDDPNPSHEEAIRELFADPVGEGPRRARRRASQRD